MTPLHWAVERGHASTVLTLLRFGADVNAETKFGKSSLEIASDVGITDVFDMLQEPMS
jgi:ankyrin repeat protein